MIAMQGSASGRSRRSAWAAIGAALLLVLATGSASAQVSVPSTSNPYLAGLPAGSSCCSGDVAPTNSPVQVAVTLSPGATVTFSATGGVDNTGAVPSLPPDGGGVFSTSPNNGISGGTWPINALVGVFLDGSLPTSSPAPADLDFSGTGIGTSFTTLSPALKQVFFIGDGLTGTGTGSTQTFVVPAGATRLFLGTTDGFGWFNNSGAFSVIVNSSAVPPPIAGAAAIPTLSEIMLVLLGLALAVATALALRRH